MKKIHIFIILTLMNQSTQVDAFGRGGNWDSYESIREREQRHREQREERVRENIRQLQQQKPNETDDERKKTLIRQLNQCSTHNPR
jgi:DNA phosphorothioation-dependent restriction protein DptG